MTIKGLVFDCDGTLADTMPMHWRAWQMITLRHELHFPEERFYALGGEPSRDICVWCTLDACPNHLCEKCHRCTDCCDCPQQHEHDTL